MLVLNNIIMQEVNVLNGLVCGFPAMTAFVGFCHRLQRDTNIKMDRVAVVVHEYDDGGIEGKRLPSTICEDSVRKIGNEHIMDSATMSLRCSLIIDCNIEESQLDDLETYIWKIRLAGSNIKEIESIFISNDFDKIREEIDDGCFVVDMHSKLKSFNGKDNLDKTLNALAQGYVVLSNGFRRLNDFGHLENSRDYTVPQAFAEPIYGIGKYIDLYAINGTSKIFWKYHKDDMYTVCADALSEIA